MAAKAKQKIKPKKKSPAKKTAKAKRGTKPKVSAKPKVSPQRIAELTWTFCPPLMVEAAIHNGVFNALDGGPKTVEETAAATGASVRGLRALMNGLVATGFLVRRGEKFAMVPDVAAYLVSGKPSYMGGLLTHLSRDLVSRWVQLSEVVRTGKPANTMNQQESGSEFFARFVEDIFNMSYPVARAAAEVIFNKMKKPATVLDIAAGSGVWGIAMAQKSPHVSVTAVDWPDVVAVTKNVVGKHNLSDRFTFVEGDMHAADLGQGHRLATLGHILHSEGESASRQLLRRVFDALAPGGTILIAEFLPNDDRRGPATPLIFAVNMLVNTDLGDTFTFKEIKSWLAETGFRKIRQLNTPGPSPLILADKP